MPTTSVPRLTLTPADVADLADALRPYHAIYGSFFSRSESRQWAERYLHGLFSPLERKSVEPIVIAQLGASEKAIRGIQQFLTDSTWDDHAILRRHWQEVAVDDAWQAQTHANGGVIISIDGIQSDKGSETVSWCLERAEEHCNAFSTLSPMIAFAARSIESVRR